MENPLKKTTPEQKLSPSEPLKGAELDQALKAVKEQRGLRPTVVNRFLSIETAETSGLSKMDKIVPATLIGGYIATFAATRLMGGEFPSIAEIPPVLHQSLQAVHNLTTNAARSPTLGEHLPFILLEAAAVWGVAKTLPDWLRARGKRQRLKEAQQTIKSRITEGKFEYDMASGHTAVFVGLGDPLADRLQQIKKPDQVMLYSQARIDNQIWQLINVGDQQEYLYKALDRGNFRKVGEVLLLPVKYEDMFLPDKTGHDMTLDEVEALIDVVDEYCKSRDIDRKKIVIVGRKTMEETYVRRTGPQQQESHITTLEELVERLGRERKVDIKVIDPTELVMDKIISLANGKSLEFVATKASDERYGERFYDALNSRNYQSTMQGSVRVFYNITDIPTEVGVRTDDIAVILDSTRKERLLGKGHREENVIVVPDMTLAAIGTEVD